MKRLLVLTTIVAAFAIPAGAARAADSYTDPAGDSKTAPDVRQVSLTDNGNGTVGVAIDLDADIPAGSSVLMGINADRDMSTGAHCGCDYMVAADDEGLVLAKWVETDWADFLHQPLDPEENGGHITFTLTLADLGGTKAFDFWVARLRGDDTDYAPEDGVFTFPQQAAKPEIHSVIVNAAVLLPKAGTVLAIPPLQVMLATKEIVTVDSMTCSLTYKGRVLAGRGRCTWKIPVSLRKKRLSLSITVTYQGVSSTVTLPVNPR
jgi:hypothetical protein